ncbi:MAG: DUF4174 domain-containing protein [Bacteroidota bacterium]
MPTTKNPLELHVWKQRVIIIFSENPKSLADQTASFRAELSELEDRDLVIYRLGPQYGTNPLKQKMAKEDYDWLVDRYVNEGDEFLVILIGKDGGVKLRSGEPVANSKLFELIDRMPMRIQEMRKGQ